MVNTKDLCNQILELFENDLYVEVASPDMDLFETGILDSSLIVEMLTILEERFGVQIAIEKLELDSLRSIKSIAKLVADNIISTN